MEIFVTGLTIFVLAIFVGFEVITKVPPTLHTPLMSGSNAISGITLVGALVAAGAQHTALGPRCSGSSPSSSPPSTWSAASWSPTACWHVQEGRTETAPV
jgi:NAD/NADP transhydrogenase alpha subunit